MPMEFLFQFDPEYADEEAELIGFLLDDFGHGFAAAVSRFCFDPNEDRRSIGGLRRLDGGGKFEAMRWDNSVVVIASGD